MFIKKIILDNYRIYYGHNEIAFSYDEKKNIFIIAGNNGFGKTTLLNSLVWCLYGKLMIDVDEKYKKEIYEAGGYRKYASNNLNRQSKLERDLYYSVTIELSDIFVPTLPCQNLLIKRTFNIENGEDKIYIEIDGLENELTKEVGPEIFINDFILPKEIAKFFFFDSEKIVELAEMKSADEKRKLSIAYSEVLGINKYEILKSNLEDLRIRFRRNSASEKDKQKYEELQKEINNINQLIKFNSEQIEVLEEDKLRNKKLSEQYQERLIREGNSISPQELIELKRIRDELSDEGKNIRNKIRDFLELAPFAFAGKKLLKLKRQMDMENHLKKKIIDPELAKDIIRSINEEVKIRLEKLTIDNKSSFKIIELINESLHNNIYSDKADNSLILIDFPENKIKEFQALYEHLKSSYTIAFKNLIDDNKKNRIYYNKIVRKISNAESKENDVLIKEIRIEKIGIDKRITAIELRIRQYEQEKGALQRDLSVKARVVSELSKKIELEHADRAKDELTERLMERLDNFILKLKNSKKIALEERIFNSLTSLLNKKDFIYSVSVSVDKDIIDIELLNSNNEIIPKESLSKGEQQLYATSILKALVEESNVRFPIFIDSPLQKFDKNHSANIISKFYPKISKQVVLFPILEKELTEQEFNILKENLNSSYLIDNNGQEKSTFIRIDNENLFTGLTKINSYV
jgi:DNA sulfur modification protein DndD